MMMRWLSETSNSSLRTAAQRVPYVSACRRHPASDDRLDSQIPRRAIVGPCVQVAARRRHAGMAERRRHEMDGGTAIEAMRGRLGARAPLCRGTHMGCHQCEAGCAATQGPARPPSTMLSWFNLILRWCSTVVTLDQPISGFTFRRSVLAAEIMPFCR